MEAGCPSPAPTGSELGTLILQSTWSNSAACEAGHEAGDCCPPTQCCGGNVCGKSLWGGVKEGNRDTSEGAGRGNGQGNIRKKVIHQFYTVHQDNWFCRRSELSLTASGWPAPSWTGSACAQMGFKCIPNTSKPQALPFLLTQRKVSHKVSGHPGQVRPIGASPLTCLFPCPRREAANA